MCYRASVYVDHVCEHDATKNLFKKIKKNQFPKLDGPLFFQRMDLQLVLFSP